jgi:thymidylate synthase ThyX
MINAKILVGTTDDLPPDIQAMLTAMYSRTYTSILSRLPEKEEDKQILREKLNKYYIGYGHKSVSQLGSTTIWLEGVSQLAAKVIENHPLFNGQESSTRYIDFAKQPMVSCSEEMIHWQEVFRTFYIKAVPAVIKKITAEFPLKDQLKIRTEVIGPVNHYGPYPVQMTSVIVDVLERYTYVEEKDINGVLTGYKLISSVPHEKIGRYDTIEELMDYVEDCEVKRITTTWENTIKARAFDICRGLLPAGCTTNVAFTGTFDTINDHFGEMLYHPCEEMRDIAVQVLTGLKEKYPHAAMDIDKLKERNKFVNNSFFYQDIKLNSDRADVYFPLRTGIDPLKLYYRSFREREKFSKFNRFDAANYRLVMQGLLDFGSYRDIHRHRNGYIGMEILGTNHGFHSFYKDNLPDELQSELTAILLDYEQWYAKERFFSTDKNIKYDLQYCTPMGYRVAVDYNCDINQALYILELRSSKTVHQTLRSLVHDWVSLVQDEYNIQIHADMDKDNFSLKRGQQTFSNLEA